LDSEKDVFALESRVCALETGVLASEKGVFALEKGLFARGLARNIKRRPRPVRAT